jgi:predicted MFS family arabinose efflux permease
MPTIVILEEWFVRRKGLAFGIMWSGTGVAGVTTPFFLSAVLDRWGSATALRIWAVVLVVLSGPLLPFLKPRIPVSANNSARNMDRRVDLQFLKSPVFFIPQAANVIQGLGYFLPSLYLPSYTTSLGLPPIVGTLSVALINAASVAGTIIVGHLIDRIHFSTVLAMISVLAVFAVFVVWGFGVSAPAIIVFSLLYGASAGGFSTTWTGNIKAIQSTIGGDSGIIIGFLSAGRGIGAVASGPLSEALLSSAQNFKDHATWGYGTAYGSLIVFSGCTAAVGGFSFIARKVGWI